MNIRSILRATLFLMLGLFIVTSCVEPVGNITPTADLIFIVTDAQDQPVEGAVVYLFPFKSPYEAYLAQNPDGNDQITPSVASEDVAVSDADGRAIFSGKALEGNSFASGTTFIHRPNPIYFRIQATVTEGNDTNYLTNDADIFKISFDELESGDFIIEEIPILLQ